MSSRILDDFEQRERSDGWFTDEPILCAYCGKPSECEISITEKDGEKECCNSCDGKFQEEE